MNNYISISEYYDVENGEQISKKLAIRDYDIIKKIKQTKITDETQARGYEYKTIIITYINECKTKTQLKLFK